MAGELVAAGVEPWLAYDDGAATGSVVAALTWPTALHAGCDAATAALRA